MTKIFVRLTLFISLALVAARACTIAPEPLSWLLAAFFALVGCMVYWGLALVSRDT